MGLKKKRKRSKLCTWQRALQRRRMGTIRMTNMLLLLRFIPVQAQRAQLLFSLMVSDFHPSAYTEPFPQRCFFPMSLTVPSNGIQESEDESEYRGNKNSQHITPGPQKLWYVAGLK